MDLRPQGPEIIRTWLFDTVVRSRLEHGVLPWADTDDQRLGARPRPQEDVEVEGQRRHADAARRGVRRRRAALLGVQRPARRSTPRSTTAIMKVGRKLAIKILNASKFVLNIVGDAPTATRPTISRRSRTRSTGRCSPSLAELVDEATDRVRRVRLRARARTHRAVLLVVLRRLRRAREGPRVRRRGDAEAALGRGRAAHRAVDAAAAVRAVHAVRHRRGVVVVARRFGPPRGVARRRRALRLDGGDPLVYEVAADVLAEVRKAKSEQKVSLATPVDAASSCTTRRSGSPRSTRARRRRVRSRARSPSSTTEVGDRAARSRSSSRRPNRRVSLPGGLRRGAWLDAHVNLETGVGVPAPRAERGAPDARADRHAAAVPRLAAARVPGGAPHRHERQDHDDAHDHRAARTRSGSRSARTRARTSSASTSASSIDDEPITDDDARRACCYAVVARRAVESASTRRTSRSSPRPRSAGSPTSRSTSRSSRSAWAARGTRRTSIDGRVAVVTNVSIDHVEYLGPTREQIATEKAGIVKPGATLVLGETDPELAPIFDARGAGARVAARRRLRRARATCSRSAAGSLDLRTPGARVPRRVPAAARRAPGRQRRDRARRGRGVRRRAARRRRRRRRVRARCGRRAGSRSSRRHPLVLLDGAHNVAGARGVARARSTRSSAPAPRTLVVGMLREKEPHEMLDRARARRRRRCSCAAGRRARARSIPRSIAEAAVELGLPDGAHRGRRPVARRGRHGAARDARRRPDRRSRARCTSSAPPAAMLVDRR